jgi:hypothetical protein
MANNCSKIEEIENLQQLSTCVGQADLTMEITEARSRIIETSK